MRLLDDAYLRPYETAIRGRAANAARRALELTGGTTSLADWANAHNYFGLHRMEDGGWIFREWAPHATSMWLVGDFNGWKIDPDFELFRIPGTDTWGRTIAADRIRAGDKYHLEMRWEGGRGERIPAFARYVTQDPVTKLFSAEVYESKYVWSYKTPVLPPDSSIPFVYEAHVGMATEERKVGTYAEFRDRVLPRIKAAGYNTVQLMAVMEHPYYGSFGYHVSSFFAASSRFGTPDDLKSLVDTAHGMGLRVIMDLVHSHAVANERDGLSRFDGTDYQYFHSGPKGWHAAWGSRCFDYGKTQVLHFLLSNCKFWLEEYGFDGYRFDGVTSMLFWNHGLGDAFTDYAQYFNGSVDDDAWVYLNLANRVIHEVKPGAMTIAEDVSGLPGVAASVADCGMGKNQHGAEIDRAVALHKMARLATLALNGGAYLNFMGNEFGHPEWIDFPRAENGWDYSHARRQWSLRDDPNLRFGELADFDAVMTTTLAKARAPLTNCALRARPVRLVANEADKVLAFVRGSLLFVFNFHPTRSYTDYGILVPPASDWRHLFDTDEPRFGGQGRLCPGFTYAPSLVLDANRRELVQQIRLYLPARTAIVLGRV